MKKDSLLKSSFWITISGFISRALIGVFIYGILSHRDGSLTILRKIKNTEIY